MAQYVISITSDVGRPPSDVVADSGYAGAAAYRTCVDRGVAPTIKGRPNKNHHGGWDRDRFTYEAALDRYICPTGQPLVRTSDNLAMRQHVYPRFTHRLPILQC